MLWLVFGAVVVAAISIGMAWEARETQQARIRHKPPGRLVKTTVGDMHAIVRGKRLHPSDPVVILEGGLMANSLAWRWVLDGLAQDYQLLAFDRLGHLWSGNRKTPLTCAAMNDELEALLSALELKPPYILVGHSFGGLGARSFAARHANEITGMVLVDTVSEHWADGLASNPSLPFWIAVRLARIGLLRLFSKPAKTPTEPLSLEETNAYRALSSSARDMSTVYESVRTLPANARSAASADNAATRVIVVASENAWEKGAFLPKGMTLAAANAEHGPLQEKLAQKFEGSLYWSTRESDHEIPWRQPELVIRAVRRLAKNAPPTPAAPLID